MPLSQVAYRCLDTGCRHEFKAGPGPTSCPACGDLYVGRLTWHALMTQARAEAVVSDRLKAMGYLVLFLHYKVPVRRANRMSRNQRAAVAVAEKPDEIALRPCMSRYLFIGIVPGQSFRAVADLPGVSSFIRIRNEAYPQRIPEEEIERLRGWGDADGCVALEEPGVSRRERFEAGLLVRIKSGPFQGFDGPVIRDDGKLVTALIHIFGRPTEVTLPPEAVEVA